MTGSASRAIRWGACERCRGGGEPSPVDSRFCAICKPAPDAERIRATDSARRLRLAVHAAARPEAGLADRAVPPDAEHIWLLVRGSRGGQPAHLFAESEETSYCGRSWLGRQARVDLDVAVPEGAPACQLCWRSYRAGTEGA